jgi:protein TonB
MFQSIGWRISSERMLDHMSLGTLPLVDRTSRLLQPEGSSRAAQWRFAAVVATCFIVHATIVLILLYRAGDPPMVQPFEEIPVEVVEKMPGAEPPPPPPPPAQKQKPEEKIKYDEIIKPAFDEPRAQNEEKVEREAPQKETHAPEVNKEAAKEIPAENVAQPDTPKIADAPAPLRMEQATPPLRDDNSPDAEALKLELQQKDEKQKSNSIPARTKKQLPNDQKAAMARQLAALMPTPDFTLGAKSKPAIVSGGTENTTYLSVLYGLIMRKMTNQNAVRSSLGTSVIFFALDENGNLIHIAVEKASGFPDIDAQTLDAVRRAAPFPPPPRDIPHRFFFSRDVERGR